MKCIQISIIKYSDQRLSNSYKNAFEIYNKFQIFSRITFVEFITEIDFMIISFISHLDLFKQ